MSTLRGICIPHGYGPAHLEMLLFRYIETLEMDHALRVLGRWTNRSPMGYYAAMVLRDLPANFFQQPRMLPTGPRFVFSNGTLILQRIENAMPMQQLHPDSTTGCVGVAPQNVLSAPVSQRRLRPLNNFMIFRSKLHQSHHWSCFLTIALGFCAPLFPGIPQKVKSFAIGQMWADDPLKSQWAVLAKAYTIIRDHFKVQNPSLRDFVSLCLTLLGLANAEAYLKMCGWRIVLADNSMNLVKTGCSITPKQFASKPLAVDQVVEHCKSNGYAMPRDEEWSKHILPDGAVFAIEQTYNGTVAEPQDWVRGGVPQWPVEEFEVDELYSNIDLVYDNDMPIVYDPDNIDLDMLDDGLVGTSFNGAANQAASTPVIVNQL
jgi:hypothetical protein